MILTILMPNLTAIVLFPAFLSVATSLMLFTHNKVTDKQPKITPETIDSTDIYPNCK